MVGVERVAPRLLAADPQGDQFTAVCVVGNEHVVTGTVRGRVSVWSVSRAVEVHGGMCRDIEPLLLACESEADAVTGLDYDQSVDTLVCVFGSRMSRTWGFSRLLRQGPETCPGDVFVFDRNSTEASRQRSAVALCGSFCAIVTQGQSWSQVMDVRRKLDSKPDLPCSNTIVPAHLVVTASSANGSEGADDAAGHIHIAGAHFGGSEEGDMANEKFSGHHPDGQARPEAGQGCADIAAAISGAGLGSCVDEAVAAGGDVLQALARGQLSEQEAEKALRSRKVALTVGARKRLVSAVGRLAASAGAVDPQGDGPPRCTNQESARDQEQSVDVERRVGEHTGCLLEIEMSLPGDAALAPAIPSILNTISVADPAAEDSACSEEQDLKAGDMGAAVAHEGAGVLEGSGWAAGAVEARVEPGAAAAARGGGEGGRGRGPTEARGRPGVAMTAEAEGRGSGDSVEGGRGVEAHGGREKEMVELGLSRQAARNFPVVMEAAGAAGVRGGEDLPWAGGRERGEREREGGREKDGGVRGGDNL